MGWYIWNCFFPWHFLLPQPFLQFEFQLKDIKIKAAPILIVPTICQALFKVLYIYISPCKITKTSTWGRYKHHPHFTEMLRHFPRITQLPRLKQSDSIGSPCAMFVKRQHASESPGGLLESQIDRCRPQNFWVSRSGVRSENLHSISFSGDSDATGLKATL